MSAPLRRVNIHNVHVHVGSNIRIEVLDASRNSHHCILPDLHTRLDKNRSWRDETPKRHETNRFVTLDGKQQPQRPALYGSRFW